MARRLTERQRKSKQANKVKARRRWQHALWCKCRKVVVLAIVAVLVMAGHSIYSGKAEQMVNRTMDSTHQSIASSGFAVEYIDLAGRSRTGMKEVREAIGFDLGEPMLRVDLDDVRSNLEKIPTIKRAAVSRAFPNRIAIHLFEREPVAIWQHKGELALVDELGTVMTDLSLHQYQGLPLMVGKNAPAHVDEMLRLYNMHQELSSHIQSVIRVSDRRWDVRLSEGITVKLPEENYEKAWNKLADMHQREQLLHRHIEAIDMRTSERMYITLAPGHKKGPAIIHTKDT